MHWKPFEHFSLLSGPKSKFCCSAAEIKFSFMQNKQEKHCHSPLDLTVSRPISQFIFQHYNVSLYIYHFASLEEELRENLPTIINALVRQNWLKAHWVYILDIYGVTPKLQMYNLSDYVINRIWWTYMILQTSLFSSLVFLVDSKC